MSALLVACLVAGAGVLAWPARRVWLPARRVSLPPRRAVVAAAGTAAAVGLVVGGPVLAVVAAAYAGLGGRVVLRRAERRRSVAARWVSLAGLAGLAADLRAGLPPTGSVAGEFAAGRLERLTSAVWRLAERTGAPAADLVERIEADARAADRAAASASAQAAGAQATALLLAGLPAAGIGLGVMMGANPVEVLLHTPLGAACALGALMLQGAGLLWADRLTAEVGR
jgi:tight adherence protein B